MRHRRQTFRLIFALSITSAAMISTSAAATAPPDDSAAPAGSVADSAVAAADDEQLTAVATNYADLVYANYSASVASATELQTTIDEFVADPTDETLQAAKDAWLTARDDYGTTEAFRFYDGPIDNPTDGPEGQINAWPMDEAYVDYVDGDPTAGIVNDVEGFPEITLDVIVSANEEGGETNISTGWHAIEFLLWGQDLDPEGPGARPVTDYTTAENADRRGTYLTLLAGLLVDDLTGVTEQWAPDGAYRADFLADPNAAVTAMFRGIGALSAGELAGERMIVAYETKDQEDEHSCFSDNTNADVRNNAVGIRNVYFGEFGEIAGPSLSDLVAAVDPELDAELRAQLDQSVELTSNFPATFETMIQADGDDPINEYFLDTVESLEDQGDLIAEAAGALGFSVSTAI